MKKWVILGLVLLLIGCKENTVQLIESDQAPLAMEEEEAKDGLWFEGFIGDKDVRLQLNEVIDRLYGKYEYNGERGALSGQKHDGFMILESELGKWYLYEEDSSLYGALVMDSVEFVQVTRNDRPHQRLVLKEQMLARGGIYYGEHASPYEGSQLMISPLSDTLIYVEMNAYNGIHVSQRTFIASLDPEGFVSKSDDKDYTLHWVDRRGWELDAKDYYGDETRQTTFDDLYSEKQSPSMATALERGIALSSQEDALLNKLLGEDYQVMMAHAQVVSEEEDLLSINLEGESPVIHLKRDGAFIYVYFDRSLFDDQISRLYTNNFGSLPVRLLGWQKDSHLIKLALSPQLDIIPLEGEHVADFIGDYTLLDVAKGKLDKDVFEDAAIVMQKDDQLVLLGLKGTIDGYRLDIMTGRAFSMKKAEVFESIAIDDYTLQIKYYGGENIRHTETFIFEPSLDYRLIKYEKSEHPVDAFEVIRTVYDLQTDEVIIYAENEILSRVKALHEELYLQTFKKEEGIDEAYN